MLPLVIVTATVVAIVGLLAWLGRPMEKPRRSPGRLSSHGQQGRPLTRYVGDYTGQLTVEYAPEPHGATGPGEVVWAWVPFEENHTQGKDRPVLLVGRDGQWLLGLQMTSQDHAAASGRHGTRWVHVGSGPWDSRRRPSVVRIDRIVRIDPAAVRREGAVLDRRRFDAVAHSLKRL